MNMVNPRLIAFQLGDEGSYSEFLDLIPEEEQYFSVTPWPTEHFVHVTSSNSILSFTLSLYCNDMPSIVLGFLVKLVFCLLIVVGLLS